MRPLENPDPTSTSSQDVFELYRDLVETSQDLIWQCDGEGRYTYLNPAWESTLGYPLSEMLGRKFSDFQTPQIAARDQEQFTRLIAGEVIKGLETVHIAKDNRPVHLVFNAKRVVNREGEVVGTRGTAHDITSRKRSEENMWEAEWKFRALFQKGPIGVAYHRMIYDHNGSAIDYRFLDANDTYIELTGVDPRGKTVLEAFPGIEKDPFDWIGTFDRVARGGEEIRFEQYLQMNNRWYDCVSYQYQPEHFVAAFIEITDRKKAEKDLKETSEMLSLFLKHSPIYAYVKNVTSTQSRVLLASENYVDMIGIPGSQMVGKTMEELFPAPFAAKISADDWAVVSRGEVLRLDEELNGRSFATIKFPIKYGNQSLLAGYTIDITDRKNAEEERARLEHQLNQSQKLEALGILAAGIAHDFNNLLGGIYGYIDLAELENKDSAVSDYLSKSVYTIDRARALTQQLLTFAKGGAPVSQVGSLFPFVQEIALFALSGSNVSCRAEVADGLWSCLFDRSQIAQIIDNLIINAKQSMPEGGTIEITARNVEAAATEDSAIGGGRFVKISIRDTGVGIPPENLGRIFDPFFTTKPQGHGLGLSTCYSIARRHGGRIDVESEQGKGSTFHVFLPAADRVPVAIVPEEHSNHSGTGVFVVMDDEVVIRHILTLMLESFGYSTFSAAHGKEAVDFFKAELAAGRRVAGLIFDLTVPGGMGGVEAIAEIRKLDVDVPVFVSSGYSEDPVMARPGDFGFTASIGKPYKVADVENMLNRYIRRT